MTNTSAQSVQKCGTTWLYGVTDMDTGIEGFRRHWSSVTACGLIIGLLAVACPTAVRAEPPDDAMKARVLGSLLYTQVDVSLVDCPSDVAFDLLGQAIGWTVLNYWSDDVLGEPARANTTISIEARDISAVLALEVMVAQIGVDDPVTWQLGRGVIEVGTKGRLSSMRVGETRVYTLDDLIVSAPYFGAVAGVGGHSPALQSDRFNSHPYRAAALFHGAMGVAPGASGAVSGGAVKTAPSDQQMLRSVLRGIVDLVEPGNWDFANELIDAVPNGDRYREREPKELASRIAKVRCLSDHKLSVQAPDFIHRALGGYPQPLRPDIELIQSVGESAIDQGTSQLVRSIRIDAEPAALDRSRFGAGAEAHRARREHDVLLAGLRSTEEARRALFSALESRVVPVDFESVPIGDAVIQFSRLFGIPVVVRYVNDQVMSGISPDARVSLRTRHVSALKILEMIAKQCEPDGAECTWQIRPGFVELGTKASLSVNAARDLRVYNVRDQLAPTSNFASNRGGHQKRDLSQAVALDCVDTIVGTIEPEAWDWGQGSESGYAPGLEAPHPNLRPPDPVMDAAAGYPTEPAQRRYFEPARPATIRYFGDVMIVVAPDYIHRQLAGYGSSR